MDFIYLVFLVPTDSILFVSPTKLQATKVYSNDYVSTNSADITPHILKLNTLDHIVCQCVIFGNRIVQMLQKAAADAEDFKYLFK